MLYVVLKGKRERTWHTGSPFPVGHDEVADVTEIQADGHELGVITEEVSSIPLAKGRACIGRWFGDDAKFIAAHLISQCARASA